MSKQRSLHGWWLGGAMLLLLVLFFYASPMPTMKQENLPLVGKVIYLDPGHGGPDGGAVSKQGIVEKKITLAITKHLRDYLQEGGAWVVMSREHDKDLAKQETKGLSRRKAEDLMKRVKLISERQADVAISIHLNAFPQSAYAGAQTFYNPISEENKKLAEAIQKQMIRTLENTNRVPKQKNDIYFLKASPVPTALVEVGFLSNPQESQLLNNIGYQKKLAAAIYYGLASYYDRVKS